MPKITISSTRVYYKELDISDALSIQNDICIYQSMKNKAYKELYDNEMYDNGTSVNLNILNLFIIQMITFH